MNWRGMGNGGTNNVRYESGNLMALRGRGDLRRTEMGQDTRDREMAVRLERAAWGRTGEADDER